MSLPDPHDLEQMGAFLEGLAAVVRQYANALMMQGFTRTEALQIAVCWQESYMQVIHEQTGTPDTGSEG